MLVNHTSEQDGGWGGEEECAVLIRASFLKEHLEKQAFLTQQERSYGKI